MKGGNDFISKVDFINNQTGWAVGENGSILVTRNSGDSWTNQVSNTENYLLGLGFVDENFGWAVGRNGTILNTLDSGNNWTVQLSGSHDSLLNIESQHLLILQE